MAEGLGKEKPTNLKMDYLKTWWQEMSEEEFSRTVPKALEYGSSSLELMGAAMEMFIPEDAELNREARHQMGLEMACTFYALGKLSRAMAGYRRGEFPSIDHAFDEGVYSRMIQYIRDHGEWV